MNHVQRHEFSFSEVLYAVQHYRWRFAATVVVVLAATAAYALLAPKTWVGSQAVVVRDDAVSHFSAAAQWRQGDDYKEAQETLQEIAISSALLRAALERVGPPANLAPGPWPTDADVEDLRDSLALAPPKGIEFGKSSVFYLKVKDRDRDRALKLTNAIFDELSTRYGQLRANINQGVIRELQESVALNETSLAQATHRLAEIEKNAGVDLVALRMLHQSASGDSSIYRALASGMDELRQLRATQAEQSEMLAMLQKAESNPQLMLAAPKELLDCHPGLARLIQGLSEARLRSFAGGSTLTAEHPKMQALAREEAGIREGIREELTTAIQGVSAAIELTEARGKTLASKVDELHERLARLTDVRAEYSNLVAQVDQRRALVEETQRNLAQSRAAFAAATTTSVLNRMDVADGGTRPLGPSRAAVGLVGLLGSLLAGLGIVLLSGPAVRRDRSTLPPSPREGQIQVSPSIRANADRMAWARVSEPVLAGERDL